MQAAIKLNFFALKAQRVRKCNASAGGDTPCKLTSHIHAGEAMVSFVSLSISITELSEVCDC